MSRLRRLQPRLKTVSGGRLAVAAPAPGGWQGASCNRIRGRRWMKIRARIIARDHGICQECVRQGTVTKDSLVYQVGHRIPLAEGGSNDDDNLECECERHAKAKTAQESARAQGRSSG
jgi:5-methylcytosine-specific restriction protein A